VAPDEQEASLTIVYKLTNLGQEGFKLALWAISSGLMVVILHLQTGLDDKHGLLPNRQLVLWLYTELNSPNLILNDKAITVKSNVAEGALKVFAPNPLGWLAYEIEGILFVKRAAYHMGANYLDRGASSQIYCNKDFIELETLGPVAELASGESVEHLETWQMFSEAGGPVEIRELI
jgi:hypothetical protein